MGSVKVDEGISVYYEEYGNGDKYILSAQVGFYPEGVQQKLAEMGYHVYCITLRGFAPSSYVTVDYGENWYDVFASDVVKVADALGIDKFTYMGASHGAGLGWHLMLNDPDRVNAFVAMVPGPHSLKEGVMSIRQMLLQGIISSPPPMDPPIDSDEKRQARRDKRALWISNLPEADEREKAVEYGRPLMKYKDEETLCEQLRKIDVPTLILGGVDDPISTHDLMIRTVKCLPHCKLVVYSNCGHNIDTDLVEELAFEADHFIKRAAADGKWYEKLEDQKV